MIKIKTEKPMIWVIYEKPSDYPRLFVARAWIGQEATQEIICSNDQDKLQIVLGLMGYTNMGRMKNDDPCIREVWI